MVEAVLSACYVYKSGRCDTAPVRLMGVTVGCGYAGSGSTMDYSNSMGVNFSAEDEDSVRADLLPAGTMDVHMFHSCESVVDAV